MRKQLMDNGTKGLQLFGDQLILETTLSNQRRNFWVFEGKANVDGKLAAQAEIKLMLQPS